MADGILKVGTITTSSGSGTITIGQSGETVDMSNATQTGVGGVNTPAFEAYLGGSGGQAISDNTVTLVTIDTEFYDTDSAYDTSTYKFTPQTAGKYMVYGSTQNESGSGSNLNASYLYIKKNGSNVTEYTRDFYNNQVRSDIIQVSAVIEFNGSSDYVELYGRIDSISGSGQLFESDTQFKRATAFGAYKIIGA